MINKRGPARRQAGFTLIETLLAILILTMAIAGPLSIAGKGLQLALIAKDQVTAAFLAQDAIEYVRFIRDTNRLNGTEWLAGLDGTSNLHTTDAGGGQANCTGGNMCTIDSLQDQATYCGTSLSSCSAFPLYYNSAGNDYTYTAPGNTQTIFTRTVSVALVSVGAGTNEADVTVTVQWKDAGGVARSVILRDNLLNWQ